MSMSEPTKFAFTLQHWMDSFTSRSMHEWARYVRAAGFSMPQFFVLMQVQRRGQCGVSDIGDLMDVSSAAASQIVEKLVQAGLLKRIEDAHDRRVKNISLTEKGLALLEEGVQHRQRWLEAIALRLTEDEQEKVSEALRILTRIAGEDLERKSKESGE